MFQKQVELFFKSLFFELTLSFGIIQAVFGTNEICKLPHYDWLCKKQPRMQQSV